MNTYYKFAPNVFLVKADSCEYDIKFLVRNFDVKPNIVKRYISNGELSEINKIINSVKK